MIKIERVECPAVLSRAKPGQYNATAVVETLFIMQLGKCCYCEATISNEGHMKAVEHFKPKSDFPDLSKEWTNLLLACSQCNGKKSNKFPVVYSNSDAHPCVVRSPTDVQGVVMMIDPSKATDADPRDSIQFIVDDVSGDFCGTMERDHCIRGRETIDIVGLDRDYYRRRRFRHYKLLRSYYETFLDAIDVAKVTKDTQDVELAFAKMMGSTLKSEEFSAFASDFFSKKEIAERFAEFMAGKYF